MDTLVHFGAGQCSELDAHLAFRPQKVLLVEADPQVAAALQARTAQLQNVQVISGAVAGSAGPCVLYRYNLPGASSLHPATGLLQLFPGLREVDEIPVDAVAPTTLLQPLQLAPHGEKLLVIDLPGEELPVLEALWGANALQLFSQVKLRCGREPLYQGCVPAVQILRWLEEHGFSLLSEDDTEDPDCPCWTLQRNVLQLRNLELANQAADLQSQLTGLQEQLKQLDQTRAEQAKKIAEQQELVEQANQAKAAQEKIASDRHAQIQQLTQARDEQAKLAGDRQAQLDTLRQERDAATKQLAEQKTQLEQANQAKAAQEKIASDRHAQIQQLTQARDEQAKLAGDRQAQLDTLRQERDAATRQLAEQKTQLEQANLTLAALEERANERLAQIQDRMTRESLQESALAANREEIAGLQVALKEAQVQAANVEAQLAERETSQVLLRESIARAEAQIDLIKDVLLRGESL